MARPPTPMPWWRCPNNTDHDIQAPKRLRSYDARTICTACTANSQNIIFRRLDQATIVQPTLSDAAQKKRDSFVQEMQRVVDAAAHVLQITNPKVEERLYGATDFQLSYVRASHSGLGYTRSAELLLREHPLENLLRFCQHQARTDIFFQAAIAAYPALADLQQPATVQHRLAPEQGLVYTFVEMALVRMKKRRMPKQPTSEL